MYSYIQFIYILKNLFNLSFFWKYRGILNKCHSYFVAPENLTQTILEIEIKKAKLSHIILLVFNMFHSMYQGLTHHSNKCREANPFNRRPPKEIKLIYMRPKNMWPLVLAIFFFNLHLWNLRLQKIYSLCGKILQYLFQNKRTWLTDLSLCWKSAGVRKVWGWIDPTDYLWQKTLSSLTEFVLTW